MEDQEILDLYFRRDEQAIARTDEKYGLFCYSVAYNVLSDREDAKECVNDTYLSAWNRIPPTRPSLFGAFLGKITRHLSIDRWRRRAAYKRTGGQVPLALEELGEIADRSGSPEEAASRKELAAAINRFLKTLPARERSIFLCRYWYLDTPEEIAEKTGLTRGHVSTMLHRTRKKLRESLIKEGLL